MLAIKAVFLSSMLTSATKQNDFGLSHLTLIWQVVTLSDVTWLLLIRNTDGTGGTLLDNTGAIILSPFS